MMLTLNDNLGVGALAGFSVKLNICFDKERTKSLIEENRIVLDNDAECFLAEYICRGGSCDNGTMEQDYRMEGVITY